LLARYGGDPETKKAPIVGAGGYLLFCNFPIISDKRKYSLFRLQSRLLLSSGRKV
jgi:hypothetical protein